MMQLFVGDPAQKPKPAPDNVVPEWRVAQKRNAKVIRAELNAEDCASVASENDNF